MLLHLIEVRLQVRHLPLQLAAVLCQHVEELLQLHVGIARAVVEINDLLGLRERQAKAFGAQGQLQTGTVARAVGAVAPTRPGALGLQQAHVLIKAHGTRSEVELFGKVADGVSGGAGHGIARRVAGLHR